MPSGADDLKEMRDRALDKVKKQFGNPVKEDIIDGTIISNCPVALTASAVSLIDYCIENGIVNDFLDKKTKEIGEFGASATMNALVFMSLEWKVLASEKSEGEFLNQMKGIIKDG